MLKPVPLFGIGVSGKSVNVNAQERLNLYCELQSDAETNALAIYGTPGLVAESNYGANPARGAYSMGDFKYFVVSDTLWQEANDGIQTNRGTLLTSGGKVSMIDNGTQIMIVDGTYGYIYNTVTLVFAQITDIEFPGGDTVTFQNGYFIVNKPGTGSFYISALYDGLSWDALDFATAESNPDPLVRVLANNGQLLLFGSISTEFWGDSGAADFPFARIGGSAIEWGLAARWSLCKYDNSLAFLRANRLGQVQVCVLVGYNATPISTPELDHVINSYSSVSDATAFAYMLGGHAFYQINFPSANNGAGQSWLYDNQSNSWSKVGGEYARHRAELQMQFLNQSIVTDYENGLTYSLNENVYTDNGAPIVRQLIGRHQATGDFSKIGRMWLEMEAGMDYNENYSLGNGSYTGIDLYSFSRASTARYLSGGVLINAAIDEPRYENGALLVEPEATNLCLYSQMLDNASWAPFECSVSPNTATAPNGAVSADSIIESANSSFHQLETVQVLTPGVYTFSIFLKANTRTWACMKVQGLVPVAFFDLANGTVGTVSGAITAAIQEIGNGWYRCSVTETVTFGINTPMVGVATSDGVRNYQGDGVSGIYAWGAQFEAGAMTSYITPNTGATTETRAADIAFARRIPTVMLQISRDGGHTFGAEIWRAFSKIGRFRTRAVWNSLGRARDWTMKFRITNAVKVVLVAVWATYSK